MKKLFFLIILFCSFTKLTIAQTGFHLGLHAGANLVGIVDPETYGKPEYEYKPKYGFMIGAVGGYDFLKFLGVQAELNFSKQGHDVKKDFASGQKFLREIDFNYFQLPLMAKLRSGGKGVKYYLLFGPQFSYLTTASIYSTDPDEVVTDAKSNGNFVKTDFGLTLGAGADILLTDNLYLNAGIRLYYGLSNINTTDPAFWAGRIQSNQFSNNAYGGFNAGIHYYF